MPRVLLTDRPWASTDIEDRIFGEAGVTLVEPPDSKPATLAAAAAGMDAVATCWADVTAEVIEAAAGSCRLVARTGIGLDNIDVAACTAAGIPVTNVPDYCIDEVADHTLAALLNFARNIGHYDRAIKAGTYDVKAGPPMRRMTGQTAGVVGLGRCGQAVAHRLRAFGLRVIGWSKSGDDHGTGVEMVAWDDLLRESDYVCVHVPLTDDTRHLLDGEAFSAMKETAYLINPSRGPVIDQTALLPALRDGVIAGAALDVWDPEPPRLDDPLLQEPTLVATPHAAFISRESLVELRERVARQIVAALRGETPESIVNDVAVCTDPVSGVKRA